MSTRPARTTFADRLLAVSGASVHGTMIRRDALHDELGRFSLHTVPARAVYSLHVIDVRAVDGELRRTFIGRESASGLWIPELLQTPTTPLIWSLDVFDALAASRPFVFFSLEEAVRMTLLRSGVLHPGVGLTRTARQLREGLESMHERWAEAFTSTFGTSVCDGCDECREGELFHRVRYWDGAVE